MNPKSIIFTAVLLAVLTQNSGGAAVPGSLKDDAPPGRYSFQASDVPAGAAGDPTKRNFTGARYFHDKLQTELSDNCWYYYGTYLKFENVVFPQVNNTNQTDVDMEICFYVFKESGKEPVTEKKNLFVTNTMTSKTNATWPAGNTSPSNVPITQNGQNVAWSDFFNTTLFSNVTETVMGGFYSPGNEQATPNDPVDSDFPKWCVKSKSYRKFFPDQVKQNVTNTTANYTLEVNVMLNDLAVNATCSDPQGPDGYNSAMLCPYFADGTSKCDMRLAPVLRFPAYINSNDDGSSGDFNWLLWGGVGIAGVVIVVLIIIFAVKGKGVDPDNDDEVSL